MRMPLPDDDRPDGDGQADANADAEAGGCVGAPCHGDEDGRHQQQRQKLQLPAPSSGLSRFSHRVQGGALRDAEYWAPHAQSADHFRWGAARRFITHALSRRWAAASCVAASVASVESTYQPEEIGTDWYADEKAVEAVVVRRPCQERTKGRHGHQGHDGRGPAPPRVDAQTTSGVTPNSFRYRQTRRKGGSSAIGVSRNGAHVPRPRSRRKPGRPRLLRFSATDPALYRTQKPTSTATRATAMMRAVGILATSDRQTRRRTPR